MKVPVIRQPIYNQYYLKGNKNYYSTAPKGLECKQLELPKSFYYPTGIAFGLDGAPAMKRLFSYGLPCIYTGIEMIESQAVNNIIKQGIHRLPAQEVCKHLDAFVNKLMDNEKEVYAAIKEQAQIEPNKNIKEIMQSLRDKSEYELIKKQAPVFKTLEAYSYSLPEELRLELKQLLAQTENIIKRTPVYTRFSVTELKYKLTKIKDDIGKLHDKKALGVINHFIKMCDSFDPKTNEKNIYKQRKILTDMGAFLARSVLRDNETLNELMETSFSKLNAEKTLIPFSRKAFIYDLSQIIKKSTDPDIKEALMKIAEKLPTSKDSTAAYITKYAKEPSDKIIYRLLWPSIATVEHLLPKSRAGKNDLTNYAGACAQINSDRSNTLFVEWIKHFPDCAKNCQKYVNRLIKYALAGIFEKEEIDVKYIENFRETIATLSEGAIVVDTTKLYQNGKFKKNEPEINGLNFNQ